MSKVCSWASAAFINKRGYEEEGIKGAGDKTTVQTIQRSRLWKVGRSWLSVFSFWRRFSLPSSPLPPETPSRAVESEVPFATYLLFLLRLSILRHHHRRLFILLGKEGLPRFELDCCDNCKCGTGMTSCTCHDGLTGGCADGCKDCHREHGLYHCRDVMDVCPESCDYDYNDDGAWRAGRSRLKAAGSSSHIWLTEEAESASTLPLTDFSGYSFCRGHLEEQRCYLLNLEMIP